MIISVVISVMVGALIWLDRVYVFQFMISRPIVLCSILGLIMGNIYIGLLLGASLELLWLNAPPVGAYLPNDDSFCAIVATPVAFLAALSLNETSAVGLALVLSIPFALVGRSVDMHIRTVNQELLPASTEDIEHKIHHAMRKSLVRSYVYALISLGLCTAFLSGVVMLTKDILPNYVITALSYMPFVSIIIGLAGLIAKDLPKVSQAGIFALGVAVVLMMTWIL
jgi:mannose/fructose/N-acetylgalactosamine-specific phosphotransferase system component IIC